jgi:GntR family transcriptional regulator
VKIGDNDSLLKKIILENVHIPLHYQISDYLMMMLEKGELGSDKKLPTEEELCNIFDVSRTTVRRALDHLLQKGFLYKKQGRGTFWTETVQKIKKEKLSGINREIFRITKKTVARVISKETSTVNPEINRELRLPEDREVVTFKRIRLADGEVMSFTINYLPREYGDGIHKAHLEKMTMLETLENVLGVDLGVIEHVVEITRATQEIAKNLGISNLDPVLTVKTSVFNTGGDPIEVVWTYFVENKYKFRVVLDK